MNYGNYAVQVRDAKKGESLSFSVMLAVGIFDSTCKYEYVSGNERFKLFELEKNELNTGNLSNLH